MERVAGIAVFSLDSVRSWRFRRKHTGFDQQLSMLDAIIGVYCKHNNRRPADRRLARQDWATPNEMINLLMAPWMKQPLQAIGERIITRDVRTFVGIAREAGEPKFRSVVRPPCFAARM